MSETKKPEIISDKAEKTEAANILKEGQKQQIAAGNDNVGVSVDECPVVPIGNSIWLKWNVKKTSIIMEQTPIAFEEPYFEVIGHGAAVKSVSIGDKLYLKDGYQDQMGSGIDERAYVEYTKKYEKMPGVVKDAKKKAWDEAFKWHIIYESIILGKYKE